MRPWRRRDWFRVQVVAAAMMCGASVIFAVPSLARGGTKVPLGIDCVGGTALFLEPDWREVHADVLASLRLRMRIGLDERRIRYADLRIVHGTVRFRLTDPSAREDVRAIAAAAAKALDLSPARWMPGIDFRARAGGEVLLSFNAIGRSALHDQVLRAASAQIGSELSCLRVPDCRVEREGDRIKLTIRHRADIPHYPAGRC